MAGVEGRTCPDITMLGKAKLVFLEKVHFCVFLPLNWTRLSDPQSIIFSRSQFSDLTIRLLWSCVSRAEIGLWEEKLAITVVSSAKLKMGLLVTVRRSLMWSRNNVGDRIDPWGTPALVGSTSEEADRQSIIYIEDI